jgi:hypothetical protein
MAFRKFLILRRSPPGPRGARPEDRLRGRLEGRTAIQPIIDDFLTAPFGRVTNGEPDSQRLNTYSIEVFCMSLREGDLFKKSLV